VGFAIASLTGVLLNNILVPLWGYGALFFTLGSFAACSLMLLSFFELEKTFFIPFDEDD
jgi:O-antigen/teichoic acid export membrane protein